MECDDGILLFHLGDYPNGFRLLGIGNEGSYGLAGVWATWSEGDLTHEFEGVAVLDRISE